MKRIFAILAIFCSTNFYAFAQGAEFKPEVKRIAVFKNGYAFTYREGEAQVTDGWAYTANSPTGVLGTVWGYSTSPNVRVMQLLASETESRENERVVNMAEFLIANEGAQIRVSTQIYEKEAPKVFTGTYTILKPKEVLNAVRTYQENSTAARNLNDLTVALKTETGTLILPTQLIQTIEVLGTSKMEMLAKKKGTRLGIKTEGAADGQKINLGLAALERGIRWIPAYRVEIKGEPVKEAKLELEATIINELDDLKNTEVYFVVGVPSFLFQDSLSPLSLNAGFAGVSSYFQGPSKDRGAYSNAIQTQVAGLDDRRAYGELSSPDASPTSDIEERTSTFSAEQLFLYQVNQLNLKKGERASQRLFSLTVPASEVFEWTINDSPVDQSNPYDNPTPRMPTTENLENRIWYGLRLKNTTKMPWTTAPAISFRDWKPLGQNLLSFTPIDGENILRVTPATEVVGSQSLVEKGRVRQQFSWNGSTYDFDLITIEGTIKIRNIKKQPVEMALTRNVTGEVLSAGDGGIISRQGLNLQAVNPNSVIKWNLTIPSGEKEIRYTYKVYVRK